MKTKDKNIRIPRPKGLSILNQQYNNNKINKQTYRRNIIQLYLNGLLTYPNGQTYTLHDIGTMLQLSHNKMLELLGKASGLDYKTMTNEGMAETLRALTYGSLKMALDDRVRHSTVSDALIRAAEAQNHLNTRLNENVIKSLGGNLAANQQLLSTIKALSGPQGPSTLINIANNNQVQNNSEALYLTNESAIKLLEARGVSYLEASDHARLALEQDLANIPDVRAKAADTQSISAVLLPRTNSIDSHEDRRAVEEGMDESHVVG